MAWACLAVVGITALRVALLSANRTDLFVDEAQYWLYAQELAFGYYSKPPMIGWVIHLVTELAGSDDAFWIRLAAPVFHGATALILMLIGRRLCDARTAAVTGLVYITLPMVALFSLVIWTDTIMFPFFALAMYYFVRCTEARSTRSAVLLGVCLGLAFLSKYTALFFLLGVGLAGSLVRRERLPKSTAALALLAFAATISPNIVWNQRNGFGTIEHTLDNLDWIRDVSSVSLDLAGMTGFFLSQFAVFGPVLFGALLWSGWRALRGRAECHERVLALFALSIVALVTGQALLSHAYGNWAAVAYLAGTLAVVPRLVRVGRGWLIASFAMNGAISVVLPLLTVFAGLLGAVDTLVLARYLGRHETSARVLQIAEAEGAAIVAHDRELLADLFYTGRTSGVGLFAAPPAGRPRNHYELKFPFPIGMEGPVLYVARGSEGPMCATTEVARWRPEGAYRATDIVILRVPGDCRAAAGLVPITRERSRGHFRSGGPAPMGRP